MLKVLMFVIVGVFVALLIPGRVMEVTHSPALTVGTCLGLLIGVIAAAVQLARRSKSGATQ